MALNGIGSFVVKPLSVISNIAIDFTHEETTNMEQSEMCTA